MQRRSHHLRPAVGLLAAGAVAALAAATVTIANPASAALSDDPAGSPPALTDCDLTASGSASERAEWRSCLQVSTELSAAPAVGQRATLKITVKSAADFDSVKITAELPPNLRWAEAPAGFTTGTRTSKAPHKRGTLRTAARSRAIGAGGAVTVSGVIEAVYAGSAEIIVRAEAGRASSETAEDAAHLTVGTTAATSQLGIPVNRKAGAVEQTLPGAPAAPSSVAAAEAGEACVGGAWTYTDKNSVVRPGRAWKVEVLDSDASGGDDLLATGTVDETGGYLLCFDNTDEDGTTQDVYTRFSAQAQNWRVQDFGGWIYSYSSTVTSNVADGSTTFTSLTPGDPTHMRAAQAFEAVRKADAYVPGSCWDLAGACRPVVIQWSPDSTSGAYYAPWNDMVYLGATHPDSDHTVIHEAGHSIMDDVYEDDYPPYPNCNPHGVSGHSSTGCAWSEGFAEWLPASVLDDPYYRWDSGASINLELPGSDGYVWDNGDGVEGRVAGALIDFTDDENETGDLMAEGFEPSWNVVQQHLPDTFAEWWVDRGTAGYDVGPDALATLQHNTIDYSSTTTTTTTTTSSGGGCSAVFSQTNPWPGGFTAEIRVTAGSQAISGWQVDFTLASGLAITNSWNGQRTGSSGAISVRNEAYNGGLAAGASTTFGFQGSGTWTTPALTCTAL